MTIKEEQRKEKKAIVLSINGAIEDKNINILDEKIVECVAKKPAIIILDFEKVTNISVEAINYLVKKDHEFLNSKVILYLIIENVNKSIFEKMEKMNVINRMFISKKYEEINIDSLEEIGKGECSYVYRLNEKQCIKVFKNFIDYFFPFIEDKNLKIFYSQKLPTSQPFNIVKCKSNNLNELST